MNKEKRALCFRLSSQQRTKLVGTTLQEELTTQPEGHSELTSEAGDSGMARGAWRNIGRAVDLEDQ